MAVKGMAHFPVASTGRRCFGCTLFIPASDPDKGRCLQWGRFTGAAIRIGLGLEEWWRGWPTIRRTYMACKYHDNGIVSIYRASEASGMAKPNTYYASWLKRIAASPLMVTKVPGQDLLYTLQDGTAVPVKTAELLIRKGWLIAQKDGLWDDPQSYRARTPAD